MFKANKLVLGNCDTYAIYMLKAIYFLALMSYLTSKVLHVIRM